MSHEFQNAFDESRKSDRLVESLEKGFSFMSDSAKTSTLWHLQKDFGISPESFPDRLDDLSVALKQIFGTGSILVEKKLTEQICFDYNLPIDRVSNLKRAVEIVLALRQASKD
jgi:hypothetical protein